MAQDLAFEALCAVSGIDWQNEITSDQRGRVNAALKQLRDLYGEIETLPMMIHERASAWGQVYPDIPLTPQALTSNWSSILEAAAHVQERQSELNRQKTRSVNAPMTGRDCICGGDKMVVVGQDLHGADECAPCPDCNADAAADYWTMGKHRVPLSPELTRQRIGK